ncbi:DUF1189 family protein [Virgibacillus halodenitrificans]|uniref:DUF1189 family protein n=1 Tax=Virgibacillus halodenitrificans TaxID=1482 RepID=UPI000372E218|nr:DUF1189 family protein [Virgibacillus halodenitrificans]
MIFLQTFLHSIKLPSKKATFWLNRIGMDITVIYMFLLLFIVSMPSLVDRLTSAEGISAELNIFFLFIYFFIFYYLPMTVLVFIMISVIAYIGTGIAKLMNRKLRFAILWKMTAFTTTIPFLLYTVLALLFKVNDSYLGLFFIYSFAFLVAIISIYPKRRKKN